MANSVDTFITDAANRQLKTALEELKKIHQQIIEINQQGVNFGGGGNTGSGTRSNASNLNALERERLRISNALETAQARLTLANEANTQSLSRMRTELRTLNSAYLQLSQRQSESARRLQDLIVRGRTAEQTQRQYNRQLREARNEFQALNGRILEADRAVNRFNRNVGNYPRQAVLGIKNLLGAFGVVGGVALIASITKGIYEQVKAQESLDLALKQVTETQAEFLRAQQFIKEQAELNGAEINSLTNAYTKFYVSASDKISVQNIENIFASITKAGSALGLSVENQERAFLALNQMFSKGTVQAEELRGQLGDALPGAIGIMTRAYQKLHPELKINEASFAKLMKDGKILAAEVLPEFARELERTYNLETIGRIENLATAQNRLANSYKNFIKELNDGDGAVSRFFGQVTRGLAKNIDFVTDAIKSSTEARKEELEFQRTASYTTELNELEALGEKRKEQARIRKEQIEEEYRVTRQQFDNLKIIQKELQEAGLQNTEENTKNEKQLQYLNNLLAGNAGQLDAVRKVLKDKNQEQIKDNELTKDQIAAQKEKLRLQEEELKNLHQLRILRIESQERILIDLVNKENEYAQTRLKNNDALNKTQIERAEENRRENLRLAKGNETKQLIALENYYKEYEDIVQGNEERILQIRKDVFNEYMEAVAKYKDEGLRVLDVGDLADEFKEKQKQHIQDVKDSLDELKKASDDYLRSFSDSFLSEAGLGSFDKFFDQIEYKFIDENGNIQKGFRSTFESLKANAKNAREEFGIYFEAISESAQEAFNFINQLQEGQFEAQYARLEKERDVALQFAGESASAREEIERQYDERRREIQRRQAESQKQNAIFNILINTAQGIVSALASTPPNVPLSIAIGAIGAVQAGIVAAQQIPEFWKGTDNAPQGWALVDEKRPEVHTDAKGNIKSLGSEKGANLRYLNKGDKIYKSRDEYFSKELRNIMKDNGISFHNEMSKSGLLNYTPIQDKGITAAELESVIRRTQPKQSSGSEFRIKKTDVKQFWTDMLAETENKNNRYSGRGRKV